MAKRKKKSSGRRHKVGATKLNANSNLVKLAAVAGGYFFSDKINAPIVKMAGDKVDGKIIGAAEAGIGAYLVLGKGRKTMVKTIAGGVLAGAGIKKLMGEFGIGSINNPYGRVPVIGNNNPYGRVPVIAGTRRVGSYTPNQQLGSYTPNASLSGRVMAGVSAGADLVSNNLMN